MTRRFGERRPEGRPAEGRFRSRRRHQRDLEGLRRHQEDIRFVLVHHEEAAAFMASGYAKSTGRLGVCLATSGPGGLHP